MSGDLVHVCELTVKMLGHELRGCGSGKEVACQKARSVSNVSIFRCNRRGGTNFGSCENTASVILLNDTMGR